ncbi:MAG: hypothetical protein IKN26_08795, partial [Eubacterium sp.]|nr:hypothetical protein [Eubacterium sp.]
VVGKRYKYIFNREDSSEELYDLKWDKEENHNILRESYYEKNRGSNVFVDELYFYPYKNKALKEYEKLKKIKNDIWVEPSSFENFYYRFRRKVSLLKKSLKNK